MKTCLLLCALLLVLAAGSAGAAPGLDIAWGGCPLNPSSLTDISDPCDENYGNLYRILLAFKAPAGITKLSYEEIQVDVTTEAPALPDWWHLEADNPSLGTPAGCRYGSVWFATTPGGASTVQCKNYWGLNPQAGIQDWSPGADGFPNHTRFSGVFARASISAGPLTEGVEYYAGSCTFDMAHAVAEPEYASCAGCQVPALLEFKYLKLGQPPGTPGGDVIITAPNLRNWITWQAGATPARRVSWGRVKSLYR